MRGGNALPLAREFARIVAIPLLYDGVARGVLQQEARREERERLEGIGGRRCWQPARLPCCFSTALLELLARREPVRVQKFLRARTRVCDSLGKAGGEAFAELFRSRESGSASNRWQRRGTAKKESDGAIPMIVAEEEPEKVLLAELQDGSKVECRPMNLESGEFFGVTLEPSDRSQHERSREEVEAELRQTIGWMEEGVVLFDEAGRVRAANERFHRMLGLTAEEAASADTLEELLRLAAPHARDPELFESAWRALEDSPEGDTQEELLMNWPVPQTLERCAREITTENGRRLGRVEVYREMTARRMFQSRMAQTEKLASLGQRVAESCTTSAIR